MSTNITIPQQLYGDQQGFQDASEATEGITARRSPRLSDIAARNNRNQSKPGCEWPDIYGIFLAKTFAS
jgi:hypothetical protein